MASRLKEEEKKERIIRGLLKLPENRRCINCNILGPQYVCITFWTTNCRGIHREFTHHVKSVSMVKFTSQELGALQEGGNQRAREIYFKGFNLQRQSLPDCRSNPGGRSPSFEPGSRKFGDYTRSPSRPEIVNDWRSEDRFASGRKSQEGSQSPEQGKDLSSSIPPVREILSDSVVLLRMGKPQKPDGNRKTDASVHTERTVSLISLASANENPPEMKVKTDVCLIDLDADPEPPAAATQAQQSTAPQSVVQTTSSADNNWASFLILPRAQMFLLQCQFRHQDCLVELVLQ